MLTGAEFLVLKEWQGLKEGRVPEGRRVGNWCPAFFGGDENGPL